MRPYSSGSGSFTLKIISARFQTSSALPTISAPAARYCSSGIPDPRPAPACTTTLWPCSTSVRTPAGIMPTRYSRVFTSVGQPTIIFIFSVGKWAANISRARVRSQSRDALLAVGGGAQGRASDLDRADAFAETDGEMEQRDQFTVGGEARLDRVRVGLQLGVIGRPLVELRASRLRRQPRARRLRARRKLRVLLLDGARRLWRGVAVRLVGLLAVEP